MRFVFLILGGISGTAFLLTLSTLSYWLSECGVTKTAIGLFVAVTIPYSFKFLLPPWLERYGPSFGCMGRAKSWLLLAQAGLGGCLIALGHTQPTVMPWATALWAMGVSFFATIHDCLMDGARLAYVPKSNAAWAASLETIGFRLGMICGGAGALYLAHFTDWKTAYILLGLALWGVGTVAVLVGVPSCPTPPYSDEKSTVYSDLWVDMRANQSIPIILGWIVCFKWGDTVMNAMITPFLWEMGYSKLEVANVTKSFGLSLTVLGSLLSVVCIRFFGLSQTGVLCAAGQSISCLLFIVQTWIGYNVGTLFIIVGIESFVAGLASATFLMILSQACHGPKRPSISQFVVLCSFGSLVRVLGSGLAGWLADSMGWAWLFGISSLVFFPTLFYARRHATLCGYDKEEIGYGQKSSEDAEAGSGPEKQYFQAQAAIDGTLGKLKPIRANPTDAAPPSAMQGVVH